MTVVQMSADTIVPELQSTKWVPGLDGVSLHSAVDSLDLATRLEASGYGDAAARYRGHPDVFAHAESLFLSSHSQRHANWGRRRDLHRRTHPILDAAQRAVVILGGVGLSLAMTPKSEPVWAFVASGAAAWITGMAVGAATWRGYNAGSSAKAVKAGMPFAALFIVLALLSGGLSGTSTPFWWTLWAVSANLLVILAPGLWLTVSSAVAGASLLVLSGPQPGFAAAGAHVVTMVAAIAAVYVMAQHFEPAPEVDLGPVRQAVGWSMLQSGSQVGVFLAAMWALPSHLSIPFAIAGLCSGAIADPGLETARVLSRRAVSSMQEWARGRRYTRWVGAVASISIVAVGWLTLSLTADFHSSAEVIEALAATSLVSALTVGTGILLRVGRDRGAALWALAAGLGMAAAVTIGHVDDRTRVAALLVLGLAVLVTAAATVAHTLSQPSTWH